MRFYRRTLLERLFARWGICGVERLMSGLIRPHPLGLNSDPPTRVRQTPSAFRPRAQLKRGFPSRYPPATKIIRPRKSTADIEPQLQPALLRLPAISQYFTHGYPRTLSSIAALALFVFSRRLFCGERHLNSFANQERNATQDLGRSNIYVRTVR